MKNLHGRIHREGLKEVQKEIDASRNRINEAAVDLNMLEKKISRTKDHANILKEKFGRLAVLVKAYPRSGILHALRAIKNDIAAMEKDLSRMGRRK